MARASVVVATAGITALLTLYTGPAFAFAFVLACAGVYAAWEGIQP